MNAPTNLVLGLGQTGFSVVGFLCARGEEVVVADSRDAPPFLRRLKKRHPKVEAVTGGLPAERFAAFDRIVVSPGLPPPDPAAVAGDGARPVEVLGDIELFAQCLRETAGAPAIGVTGSNGKSTVTTMVAELLTAGGFNALAGGNLGPPALDLLGEPRPDFYVLELSSFQLQTTRRIDLAAAAILNLSEDHLDRHGDMQDYAAAKARILPAARAAVLSRDDPGLSDLRAAHPDAVTFGLDAPPGARDYGVIDGGLPRHPRSLLSGGRARLTERGRDGGGDLRHPRSLLSGGGGGKFLARGTTPLAPADNLAAPGAHNIANALAALALVECAGVEVTPAMLDALIAWRGLEHRCELTAEVAGVRWVNDSKATNVGATIAAIAGLCGAGETVGPAPAAGAPGMILIAGGLGKGADFMPLRGPVGRHIGRAVLFGKDAPRLAEALAGCARLAPARNLRQAVGLAAAVAKPGQTVLFSPACASFDQFDDYQARGQAFKELVAELASEVAAGRPPALSKPVKRRAS